jgi:uncharacterized membrane protein
MKFLLVIKFPTILISNIVLIITAIIVWLFTFFKQYVTISIIKGIKISCLTERESNTKKLFKQNQ